MVIQLFIIIFWILVIKVISLAMWQKSVTFSSLCYVKFTDNSFVEYFVHILSKVSEAKKQAKEQKKQKKTGTKKIIRPHAFDHSVQLCACGQRRLTEEELGTSQPFPCTTTPSWPSAVHWRRWRWRRHRLCCMSRRERRAARCPKLRSQSAPSLLRTEPSWVS